MCDPVDNNDFSNDLSLFQSLTQLSYSRLFSPGQQCESCIQAPKKSMDPNMIAPTILAQSDLTSEPTTSRLISDPSTSFMYADIIEPTALFNLRLFVFILWPPVFTSEATTFENHV